MVCVDLFDAVDVGPAEFQVTDAPPLEVTFATYNGQPVDWHLWLTGDGAAGPGHRFPPSAAGRPPSGYNGPEARRAATHPESCR